MQPNQNMQNVPGINNTPIATPTPGPTEAEPVFRDAPKKRSRATLLGMICLALLAAGGIGFGVWAILDGNQKTAKLNEQITDLRAQLAEQQPTIDEDATIDDSTTIDSQNFIYINDWGLKIQIPDNLSTVSFVYNATGDASTLCVNGAKYNNQQYEPDFLNIDTNQLGCVYRIYKNPNNDSCINFRGITIFEQSDYCWKYIGPQVVYSTDENEIQWEFESAGLIREMLTNPDNYSPIQ